MGWIPENQRGTDYYIFHEKYMCSVPYLASRSKEDIREFGVPSVGIKEMDNALISERIPRYLTIAQMLKFYKEGTTVGVSKESDTKRIYERITDHLEAWKVQLSRGLNNGDAPIEDLIDLDNFANSVYKHARHHMTEEIVHSFLLRQMDSIAPITRDSLMAKFNTIGRKNEAIKENKEINENDNLPRREEMSQFFSGYQARDNAKSRW